MEKKSDKTPDKTIGLADIKKHLEAASNHEVTLTEDRMRSLWYPAGAYSIDDGTVTSRTFLPLFPGKSCAPYALIDVTGASSTGPDGTAVLTVSAFTCASSTFAEPSNVVATPRTTSPVFLTMTHSLTAANDLQINVFTWDANGKPAPDVEFDWRCRAVSVTVIP